jgi:hypothetical protein
MLKVLRKIWSYVFTTTISVDRATHQVLVTSTTEPAVFRCADLINKKVGEDYETLIRGLYVFEALQNAWVSVDDLSTEECSWRVSEDNLWSGTQTLELLRCDSLFNVIVGYSADDRIAFYKMMNAVLRRVVQVFLLHLNPKRIRLGRARTF